MLLWDGVQRMIRFTIGRQYIHEKLERWLPALWLTQKDDHWTCQQRNKGWSLCESDNDDADDGFDYDDADDDEADDTDLLICIVIWYVELVHTLDSWKIFLHVTVHSL